MHLVSQDKAHPECTEEKINFVCIDQEPVVLKASRLQDLDRFSL